MVIALGLAAGPAAALGLARFAYALLLPAMRDSLHWTFATSALMNSANAVGYLLGAVAAAKVARRLGARPTFLGGLVFIALALLASALSGDLAVLVILRAVSGVAGAATFIIGAALTAQLGAREKPRRSALLLGVYFAGGGLGIAVSGMVLPVMLAVTPADAGWRWGWIALGLTAVLSLAAAVPAAKRAPEPVHGAGQERANGRAISMILIAYSLYGAGYIAYMTFIVALLEQGGAGTDEVTAFWIALGLAAMLGGFVWGPVIGRLRGGRGSALLMAVVAVGAALPLIDASPAVHFASAALFGIAFLAVVTAVTHTARTVLEPAQWTAGIALLTTGFALGQCIGPVLSGMLADIADGVRAGMLLSVGILAIAAVVALAQRQPRKAGSPWAPAPTSGSRCSTASP
ncbi:MAG TPA: YbfB/YjiJ family MFS transporter [Gemmatimonadales bacterium]|nr:YbfB/YjiJ family MFS transporter [Gemmatimonadales bacterium]